jgi:hypothetical protein
MGRLQVVPTLWPKSLCRIRRFSPLTASQTFSVRSSLADGFGGEVLRAQVIDLVDD